MTYTNSPMGYIQLLLPPNKLKKIGQKGVKYLPTVTQVIYMSWGLNSVVVSLNREHLLLDTLN